MYPRAEMSSLKYMPPPRLLLMDVKSGVPRGPLGCTTFPAGFLVDNSHSMEVHLGSSHIDNDQLVSLRRVAEHEVVDFDVVVYYTLAVKELHYRNLPETKTTVPTLSTATMYAQ